LPGRRICLAILPDPGGPEEALLAALTPEEQGEARHHPPGRRRRQFALGRLAAHRAIRRALGVELTVLVLVGAHGEPVARVDGAAAAGVSLSHAGRLAVACAWLAGPEREFSAGIDLERVRPAELVGSPYAFSPGEKAMLGSAPQGELLASLAAWTVKEAAWKALRPAPPSKPAEIEVTALQLDPGWARVEVGPRLAPRLGERAVRVRLGLLEAANGQYLLTVAEVAPGKGSFPAGRRPEGKRRSPPRWPGEHGV